jgi:hypothetical protein
MYVGSAINLKQRFKQHATGPKRVELSDFLGSLDFFWMECPSESADELRVIEQSLITVFGPPLNKINAVSPGVRSEPQITGSMSTLNG